MVILIMGVTASGKTTIGRLLTGKLGWSFYDADDYHTHENVEKMRRGIALTDRDRWPWIEQLRVIVQKSLTEKKSAALACSALKQAYRERLVTSDDVKVVYLKIDRQTLKQRLQKRREHFFNPMLIDSQFADLQEPEGALWIDASMDAPLIVDKIISELKLARASSRTTAAL